MIYKMLWTSGWDSTFRLADLILIKKQTVQPYYIIDEKRESNLIEQNRMEEIRDMMISMDPGVADRLLPVIKTPKSAVPKSEAITKKFQNLKASGGYIGVQYIFLAEFAEYFGLNHLELCIHKDDKAHAYLEGFVEKNKASDSYSLRKDIQDENLNIFKYYDFPLFDITKINMQEYAVKNGFQHIMERTWFCHTPTKNGEPCGLCNPCKYTIEEGLGRRVPKPSLIRKMKRYAMKQTSKALSRLSAIKRKILNITSLQS